MSSAAGALRVAAPCKRKVHLGARHVDPRCPAFPVRLDRPGRQSERHAGHLVVEQVRVDGEAIVHRVAVGGLVVTQDVEAHPGVEDPLSPVVPRQHDFFDFVGVDLDRQPAVVRAVDVHQHVGASGRERAGLPPQQVLEHPAVRVVEKLLEPVLSPVFQEIVGVAGVPVRRRRRQRLQPVGRVVAEPQQQTIECCFEVMLPRQLLELVVLDGVRRVRAHESITQKHRRRDHAADLGGQIQLAVGQLELEPVEPQASVANLPSVGGPGLAQLRVQRRGPEPRVNVIAVVLDRRAGGRGGQRGGSGAQPERAQERAAGDSAEGAMDW